MEKYTEYRAMMFKDGKWRIGTHWWGMPVPTYRDKESCMKAIEYAVQRWKKESPQKQLPEKWAIQYREVVRTDWMEYC